MAEWLKQSSRYKQHKSAFISSRFRRYSKENDKTKKEQLIDQYQDIARQKEDIIKQNYNAKLQEINNEIAEKIKHVAKKNKCNIILLNSAVMQGGFDITHEVISELR